MMSNQIQNKDTFGSGNGRQEQTGFTQFSFSGPATANNSSDAK